MGVPARRPVPLTKAPDPQGEAILAHRKAIALCMCRSIVRHSQAGLIVLLLAIGSGCVRNVAVQPPRPTFAIEVHNTFDVDMLVSYDAGGGLRALGAVTPGGTERFVIAVPEAVPIQVTARSSDGSRTAGPFEVVLAAEVTRMVTLR